MALVLLTADRPSSTPDFRAFQQLPELLPPTSDVWNYPLSEPRSHDCYSFFFYPLVLTSVVSKDTLSPSACPLSRPRPGAASLLYSPRGALAQSSIPTLINTPHYITLADIDVDSNLREASPHPLDPPSVQVFSASPSPLPRKPASQALPLLPFYQHYYIEFLLLDRIERPKDRQTPSEEESVPSPSPLTPPRLPASFLSTGILSFNLVANVFGRAKRPHEEEFVLLLPLRGPCLATPPRHQHLGPSEF
jgi:hypothetical protein